MFVDLQGIDVDVPRIDKIRDAGGLLLVHSFLEHEVDLWERELKL